MSEMIIRRASTNDIPAIREIYNQGIRSRMATCDEDEQTLEERTSWFQQFNDRYPIFVGEVSGQVAAYGCLFKYSPKSGYRFATENSLYVHDDFQGKGLGRKMLVHLIEAAKANGLKYIEARIFSHNKKSLALHESLGFKLLGVQPRIGCLDEKFYDNSILYLALS
jgi:L-amino acid N-acyltransferase YncA